MPVTVATNLQYRLPSHYFVSLLSWPFVLILTVVFALVLANYGK